MINPDKAKLDKEMAGRGFDQSPVPLLEKIKQEGRVWNDLADQYGVDNPHPPWQVSLEGTCDVLAGEACALPGVERRWEEDALADTLYAHIPCPERRLLALAHSLIRRGLIDEEELSMRMKEVERRLNMT